MAGSSHFKNFGNFYLYHVVEFPDEAVDGNIPMSVISHSWLSKNEKGDFTCLWPKRATDSQRTQLIRNHECPSSFTTGNRVNIKYKSFTYEKALSKMNALENMQSVDQSEVSEIETRRRGTHKPKHFEDFVSSSGSEEDLPRVNLKTKRMKRVTTDLDVYGNNSNSKPTYQTEQQDVLEQPTTSHQHSQDNNDVERISHQYNNNDYLHSTPSSTPISWRSSHNSCGCKNNEVLLKNLLTTMKSMCSEIKIIKQCLSINEDGPEESELTKLFPFTTQEQLEHFNATVTEKTPELVSFFQLIGGKDVLDTTRRILSKIVGQNLSESYNWCGKNNKPAFNNLKNIISFIVGVVRKNKFSKDATQQEVETIIKSWLRTATDRNGGRNKRRKASK